MIIQNFILKIKIYKLIEFNEKIITMKEKLIKTPFIIKKLINIYPTLKILFNKNSYLKIVSKLLKFIYILHTY